MAESMNAYSERVGQEILPAGKSAAELEQDRTIALETEQDVVDLARSNAKRAAEIQGQLLDRALQCDDRELGSVMRAVSDVQAKSLDGLLKLTGRAPDQGDGGMSQLLRSLASQGLVKLNVDLQVGEGAS